MGRRAWLTQAFFFWDWVISGFAPTQLRQFLRQHFPCRFLGDDDVCITLFLQSSESGLRNDVRPSGRRNLPLADKPEIVDYAARFSVIEDQSAVLAGGRLDYYIITHAFH